MNLKSNIVTKINDEFTLKDKVAVIGKLSKKTVEAVSMLYSRKICFCVIDEENENLSRILESFAPNIIFYTENDKLDRIKDCSNDLDSIDLSCVVYTSGTTGYPKGIEIKKQSIKNFKKHIVKIFEPLSPEIILINSGVGFDMFISEIIYAITLNLDVEILDINDPVNKISDKRKIIITTPTKYKIYKSFGINFDNDIVCLGGEPSTTELVSEITAKNFYFNLYGPAECTFHCAFSRGVELGEPIDGVQFNFKKTGKYFALSISGECLFRGYINYEKESSFFDTGDLFEKIDENYFFVERNSEYEKINGIRVYVDEIKSRLLAHKLVKNIDIKKINDEIVIFFNKDQNYNEILIEETLNHFNNRSFIIKMIEKIDNNSTINGKFNYNKTYSDFSNSLKEDIADKYISIIEDVLGNQCDWSESFSVNGGTSLKAIKIKAALKRIGKDVKVIEIMKSKSINEIFNIENKKSLMQYKLCNDNVDENFLDFNTMHFIESRDMTKNNVQSFLEKFSKCNDAFQMYFDNSNNIKGSKYNFTEQYVTDITKEMIQKELHILNNNTSYKKNETFNFKLLNSTKNKVLLCSAHHFYSDVFSWHYFTEEIKSFLKTYKLEEVCLNAINFSDYLQIVNPVSFDIKKNNSSKYNVRTVKCSILEEDIFMENIVKIFGEEFCYEIESNGRVILDKEYYSVFGWLTRPVYLNERIPKAYTENIVINYIGDVENIVENQSMYENNFKLDFVTYITYYNSNGSCYLTILTCNEEHMKKVIYAARNIFI